MFWKNKSMYVTASCAVIRPVFTKCHELQRRNVSGDEDESGWRKESQGSDMVAWPVELESWFTNCTSIPTLSVGSGALELLIFERTCASGLTLCSSAAPMGGRPLCWGEYPVAGCWYSLSGPGDRMSAALNTALLVILLGLWRRRLRDPSDTSISLAWQCRDEIVNRNRKIVYTSSLFMSLCMNEVFS